MTAVAILDKNTLCFCNTDDIADVSVKLSTTEGVNDIVTFEGAASANVLVKGVADPVDDNDVSNKKYVVDVKRWHEPVQYAIETTAFNVNDVASNFDGNVVADGERVLVISDATDGLLNGIWEKTATAYVRPTDFATGSVALNVKVLVEQGTHAGNSFVCTNAEGNDTVDTHTLNFSQLTGNVTTSNVVIKNPTATQTVATHDLHLTANIASTDATTGTLVVTGGVGVTGNMHVTGNGKFATVTSTSDERLKKDVEDLSASEKFDKIRPVSYKWKSNDEQSHGVLAQQLQTLYPEMVKEDGEGLLSVDYNQLIGVLIAEVQSLKKSV
jgi:hypothetical protein